MTTVIKCCSHFVLWGRQQRSCSIYCTLVQWFINSNPHFFFFFKELGIGQKSIFVQHYFLTPQTRRYNHVTCVGSSFWSQFGTLSLFYVGNGTVFLILSFHNLKGNWGDVPFCFLFFHLQKIQTVGLDFGQIQGNDGFVTPGPDCRLSPPCMQGLISSP